MPVGVSLITGRGFDQHFLNVGKLVSECLMAVDEYRLPH